MSRVLQRSLRVFGCLCLAAAAAACDSGGGPRGTQTPAGAAGTNGQAGTGAAGSTGVAGGPGGAGPAGQTGSAGTAPPATGAAGTGTGAAGTPAPPAMDAGAAGTGAGGATDAAATVSDAATASDTAGGPALPKVALIFTRSGGGYRHESIEPGAAAIKAALMPMGITSEVSDDLTLFTTAGLARFGVVVLISTSGAAFGAAGAETAAVGALVSFVRAGGGVVAIHAATATAYDGMSAYVQLLGGKFIDHPGGIRNTPCFVEGAAHPTTTTMPATFMWNDEIYTFRDTNPGNQVVVTCTGFNSTMHIPISWHRREGAGRVFNTAMGHSNEHYAATGILLKDHLVPGILWTLGLK